jgi:hypothetical protein
MSEDLEDFNTAVNADPYKGLNEAQALRALALALSANGQSADVAMLSRVADYLDAKEKKAPLPEKWSAVTPGAISPAVKMRFVAIIGEDRLREISLSDFRVMEIEKMIRDADAEVSGNESNVAVAWRAFEKAKSAYFAAHEYREKAWKKQVYLRQMQRNRIEDVMRAELGKRVDQIRGKVNLNMSKEIPKEHRARLRHRRIKTRMQVIPPDAPIPQAVIDARLREEKPTQ